MGPIFVGGDGRSGTTLLALLLHKHPHIAMMVELHFAGTKSLLNNRQFLVRAERNGFDSKWLNHHLLHWPTELETFAEKCAFVEFLGCEFKGKARGTWGLKIMREIRYPDTYAMVWPDAKFLCMVRDPRDVYASQKQWPSWGYTDPTEAGNGWASIVDGALASEANQRGMVKVVVYEELAKRPSHMLPPIWDWLGFTDWPEHFMPGDLQYPKLTRPMLESRVSHYSKQQLQGPVADISIGRWRNELSGDEAAAVMAAAGEMAERYGYV